MMVKFVNKSRGRIQFPLFLGVTDMEDVAMRPGAIGIGETLELELEPENAWTQYEKVLWQNARNFYDQSIVRVALKKRKEFKKSSLKEPILEVDARWDYVREQGNCPGERHTYILDELNRLYFLINVSILVEVPAYSFVSPYRKLVLNCEVKPFTRSEWSEDRVKNDFHLALRDRRGNAELKKLGIIK